jgi:hypothetical protein
LHARKFEPQCIGTDANRRTAALTSKQLHFSLRYELGGDCGFTFSCEKWSFYVIALWLFGKFCDGNASQDLNIKKPRSENRRAIQILLFEIIPAIFMILTELSSIFVKASRH